MMNCTKLGLGASKKYEVLKKLRDNVQMRIKENGGNISISKNVAKLEKQMEIETAALTKGVRACLSFYLISFLYNSQVKVNNNYLGNFLRIQPV